MVKYPVDEYLDNCSAVFNAAVLSGEEYQHLKKSSLSEVMSLPAGTGQVIFVAGQPGAGKNHFIDYKLKPSLNTVLNNSGAPADFLLIDHDNWRKYHPRFEAYTKENPATASLRIQDDIDRLEREIVSYAIDDKKSFILSDGAFGVYERTQSYLNRMNDVGGYQKSLYLLAVNMLISEQNVRYRYELEYLNGKSASIRWVMHPIQFGVYKNTIDCLQKIDLSQFDQVAVVDRYHNEIFQAQGRGLDNTSLIAVIEKERNRDFTQTENENYHQRWKEILIMAIERGAEDDELAHLSQIVSATTNVVIKDSSAYNPPSLS